MNENKSVTPGPSGVSRRTVVKGAAWAVPAIAVASSVPAMAASPCVSFSYAAGACKDPGNPFGYFFSLCVDTEACDDTGFFPLVVTRIDTNNGTYLTDSEWGGPKTPGSPITTATFATSGDCQLVEGYAHGSASTLTFNYTLANGMTGSFDAPAPPSTGGCTTG